MADVDSVINDFGTKLVTDLRTKLREKNVTFGGGADSRLAAKTEYKVTYTSDGFEFDLLMPPEWYWVNEGRKPGPVSEKARKGISDWAKRKGIVGKFITDNLQARVEAQTAAKAKLPTGSKRTYKTLKKLPFDKGLKSLTYLVARKVTLKGYEPTHFYDEVINDGRLIQFQKALSEAAKKQIIIEIRK